LLSRVAIEVAIVSELHAKVFSSFALPIRVDSRIQ
jgi:hypothetical protein